MSAEQLTLCPRINCRVIDRVVRNILENPIAALTELIANAWDAGATEVDIQWPLAEGDVFSIRDNGHGMSAKEFENRWMEIGYNRLEGQGKNVVIKDDDVERARLTFGRNGIGKFASFCFANSFFITTYKDRNYVKYHVVRNYSDTFFNATPVDEGKSDQNGTLIESEDLIFRKVPETEVQFQIAQRFLLDPLFNVKINGSYVSFSDLPERFVESKEIIIDEDCIIIMFIIKRDESDRTNKYSGIAWHVNGRLVGQHSWSNLRDQRILDGRTTEAKRHALILKADCLEPAVSPDWSGFDEDNELYKKAVDAVEREISLFLEDITEDTRAEKIKQARNYNIQKVNQLGHISLKKWDRFIDETVKKCPSISVNELSKIGDVLASLELSQSKYSILSKLAQFKPGDWDKLNSILCEWTVDLAKEVLDEIQYRIKLIEELRIKIDDEDALEVQELQPIIEKTLWIFGPEFESIHYTSNQAMANVIIKLRGKSSKKASLNRPDFVIMPDGAVSFHCTYGFGDDHHEEFVDNLVVVELKAPSVAIGREEKNQPSKYVDEFKKLGIINEATKVNAFVLGLKTQRGFSTEKLVEGNTTTKIILFNALLRRAESRLFDLKKRVQSAPFLVEHTSNLLSNFEK